VVVEEGLGIMGEREFVFCADGRRERDGTCKGGGVSFGSVDGWRDLLVQ
jgi:hypothetical protein